MQNQIFNFSRFTTLWRYDLLDCGKAWLVFLITITVSGIGCEYLSDRVDWLSGLFFGIFSAVFAFGPFVFTARMFNNISDKRARVQFLMLPASKPEKFLTRLINMVILPHVFTLVLGTVLLACADVGPDVTEFFQDPELYTALLKIIGVCLSLSLFVLSIEVLCATFFTKHVLAKMIIVIFVLQVVTVNILRLLKGTINLSIGPGENGPEVLCNVSVWPFNTVMLLGSALLTWLAYVVFCRKTV